MKATKTEIRIHTEPVTDGSRKVYIYTGGGSFEERSAFETTGLFSPAGDDPEGVEWHGVLGKLSTQINLAIGRAALDLGYQRLYFSRSQGKGRLSRFGTYQGTSDGLDHYVFDLSRLN